MKNLFRTNRRRDKELDEALLKAATYEERWFRAEEKTSRVLAELAATQKEITLLRVENEALRELAKDAIKPRIVEEVNE